MTAEDKFGSSPWDDDAADDYEILEEQSIFDAFPAWSASDYSEPPVPSDMEDGVVTAVFTATNPAGTVSVTALMNGRVLRVDLEPAVSRMTEGELAREIALIARLATRQALAGQHLVIAALMRRLGQDPAETRSFLERQLSLPTPDTVMAERAELFAAHYAADRE